jgi:hypothetical protein
MRSTSHVRFRWLQMIAGLALVFVGLPGRSRAEVSVPNIFSSHMVLQQAQKNRVWGKASPDEEGQPRRRGDRQHRQAVA